jgi:tetratricopeptide (TPR) repeat protein
MRACALWGKAGEEARGSTGDRIALLLRTSQVGEQAGVLENTEILDQALSLVDRQRQPLQASTLLAERGNNAWMHYPSQPRVRPELLEAVQLTEPFPDRPERAVALSYLADAELWEVWELRTPELPARIWAHVQEAVEVAQRSGSGAAMAQAFVLSGGIPARRSQIAGGLTDAEASYLLAKQTGQVATMEKAAIWQAYALAELGRRVEVARLGQTVVKELFAEGSSQWGCDLGAMAANGLFELGRWSECDDLLREALSASRTGIAGATARQIAARLAAQRGEVAVAQQHLDRALELVPIDFSGLDLHSTLLELLVGRGDSQQALDLVQPVLKERLALMVDRGAEYVLLWGARAAADVAERARDRRDLDAERKATHLLDELLAIVETTPPARPWLSVEADPIWFAYRATTIAERARCRGSAGQAAAWERAAGKHHAIGFRWFEATARWRQAQAMLSEGAARSAVAEPLRRAQATALDLGAAPLVAETESLAGHPEMRTRSAPA